MSAFSLPIRSSNLTGIPSQAYGTLRYHIILNPETILETQLRCMALAPIHFRRRDLLRPVSCYAFFKGWLLLSQPPGCFGLPHPFPLSHNLGTLAGGLGCFPLDYGP